MFLLIQTPMTRPAPARRNRPLEEVEAEQQQKRKPAVLRLGKVRLKRGVLYAAMAAGLLALMGMVYAYQEMMPVRGIAVSIEAAPDSRLLDEAAVQDLLAGYAGHDIAGQPMKRVELQRLEDSLLANRMIRRAEVYKSMLGVVHAEVAIREPAARIMNNSGNSVYMDGNGYKFPVSELHTAHVVLIRGDFEEGAVDTFACNTIPAALKVLNFIRKDAFWNAQIAEIAIDQGGALTLYPQIGDTKIEFGYPGRIEEKFSSLMDFYRQVMPEVGWNRYRSLNVAFQGQVIARRR
ncbi:MAG: cell division protein FtsQ/DivIB [Bacteroidia bacterium]|nr:cell division protein FtsQ/DivIB [Bacteroidia bacterium]